MAYYSQINLKNLTAFLLPSRKVTPCLYSPQCQCIFMVQEKIQEHSMYLCQNLQYRRIQNPYGELFLILIFLLLFPQHNFFHCTAWGPSYTYMYTYFFLTLSCSIIRIQTQFSVLHSRISLLIHSKCSSLHLVTPSTQSIPIPPHPPRQPQVYFPSPGFSFLWKSSFVLCIRFQI